MDSQGDRNNKTPSPATINSPRSSSGTPSRPSGKKSLKKQKTLSNLTTDADMGVPGGPSSPARGIVKAKSSRRL